jgi:hypothetical protein
MEMASKYTEELAAWVRRGDATGHGRNLVAFLAVKPDVSAALAEGYSVKTIWTHMNATKRIEFGYVTFLNYVHKHLKPARGHAVVTVRDPARSTQIQGTCFDQRSRRGEAAVQGTALASRPAPCRPLYAGLQLYPNFPIQIGNQWQKFTCCFKEKAE